MADPNTGSMMGIDSSNDKDDIDKLLAHVIQKRKTIPAKCMEIQRDIIRYELKRLENAQMETELNFERGRLTKLLHKLKSSMPINMSFNDLYEAEEKLMECHARSRDINSYLKQRKLCVK